MTIKSNIIRLFRLTYLHLEVVEGVLVNVFHLFPKPHGVVCQSQDV